MKDGDQKDRRGKLYTEENLCREENLKLNIIKGKYCLHETFKKKSESVSRSVMSDSAIPWTVVHHATLSIEFSKQEYGVGSHFLLLGIFQTQGLNPISCTAGRFFIV